MNKSKKPFITICLALLSALFFSDIQAQTKKPPTIAAGVVNGKAVTLPKPEYPADAKKQGVTGKINVQVVIDENGRVISAKAVSGIENTAVRKACEDAAMKSKFSPTMLSGKPVKVSGVIEYNFVEAVVSNEEKVKVFGVSTFLFMLRNSADEMDKFNNFFESQDFIKESINEFSEFSAELAPLSSIEKLTPDARQTKINEVISSVKGKLNSSGLWQFELGENFGGMMSQLIAMRNGEAIDITKFNEEQVKRNLLRIKELCLSAPSDFPKDVLAKLDEFGDFGNKNQIMSAENFEEFFNKMQALIETISPGSTN